MMENEETITNIKSADLQNINRKSALKKLGTSGKKVFFSALPLSLIGLSAKPAAAQFDDLEVARALNYILQIEFMQEAFYLRATGTGGLIPPELQAIFNEIRQQHQKRVVLVKNIIGSLDVEPTPQLNFDFTSGSFSPYDDFDDFLGFAQIIEDLAAGVYKEQANNIYQNNASNETKRLVLRLHSTETRHAYYVRNLRTQRGLDSIKGWIDTANTGNLPTAFENIYVNESNTNQQEIEVPSVTESPLQAIQEAWDEPIGRGLANSILQLFTQPL